MHFAFSRSHLLNQTALLVCFLLSAIEMKKRRVGLWLLICSKNTFYLFALKKVFYVLKKVFCIQKKVFYVLKNVFCIQKKFLSHIFCQAIVVFSSFFFFLLNYAIIDLETTLYPQCARL